MVGRTGGMIIPGMVRDELAGGGGVGTGRNGLGTRGGGARGVEGRPVMGTGGVGARLGEREELRRVRSPSGLAARAPSRGT